MQAWWRIASSQSRFRWRARCSYSPPSAGRRSRKVNCDVAQQRNGFSHTFHRRQHHVLVLDGQNIVVANLLERGTELPPPGLTVTVTECDVIPGSFGIEVWWARIERAVDG